MLLNHPAPTIYVRNAYLAFNQTILFDNFNFTLVGGKCTCLLGPSGIGKTSLLRLIAGLIKSKVSVPENITVHASINSPEVSNLSSEIAYMAQTDLLLPWLSVLDNVLLSARLRSEKISSEKISAATELLNNVGLKNIHQLFPRQLSGGMRQRVALVRTLFQNKSVILMDEPFSALDAITRYQLQTLTAGLFEKRTVLLITHDPLEALRLADHIYIMAGQPASLHIPLTLTTLPPRDAHDITLQRHHANLLTELSLTYGMDP